MSTERRSGINFGFLVQLITVAGALYVIFAKPAKWDAACESLKELAPRVESNTSRLIVLETKISDQNDRIFTELKAINKKIGR